MPSRSLFAVLVAAVALAGCGGADAPTPMQERATARAALLRLDDLPRGWTARARASGEGDRCPAQQAAGDRATARANTANLTDPAGVPIVSSAVFLLRDARAAETTFAELTSRATRDCLVAQVGEVDGADGARFTGATSVPTATPRVGNAAAGLRIGSVLRAPGADPVRVEVDQVTVRSDRGVARVTFTARAIPVSGALRTSAVRSAQRRLAAALAR